MNIKINGKIESVDAKTLLDIVKIKQFHQDRIVIEHNLTIIPKENWDKTQIQESDNIEIVSFVGGG